MLGNTNKSRTVSIILPWTFLWGLVSWTRGKSPLQDKGIMWEDEVRVSLPFLLSETETGQKLNKSQRLPLLLFFFKFL